ncbi:MAG TPA: ATP-binding protein [Sphingomonas sp.]|nr:ATP-binding protein [Sphingomonas sp.]
MPAPLIHLICGSTGAGKTTYALRLSEEIDAARFSIDEWMSALFWMDSPQPIDPAWTMPRIERCAALIWRTAVDVAKRGMPCVLELGLTTRAVRARYAALARTEDLPVRLHFLDVPPEERWRRVAARNHRPDPTAQLDFRISRAMFDYVEAMWEPPTPEEMAAYDGVRIG